MTLSHVVYLLVTICVQIFPGEKEVDVFGVKNYIRISRRNSEAYNKLFSSKRYSILVPLYSQSVKCSLRCCVSYSELETSTIGENAE